MVATMDEVVALAERCRTLQEVQKELIPALKKLEKSSTPSSSNTATATTTATTAQSAGGTTTTTTSSAPPLSILESRLKDGSDPLDKLSPVTASVAYLFILNSRLHLAMATPTPEVWTPLYKAIVTFTEQYDPIQLRLVTEHVVFFVRQLTFAAESHGDALVAVQPLRTLVERFAPSGTLTAIHPLFLQFVLRARVYSQATPLLRQVIDDVDVSAYPVRYQDHLAYHYLGGVILCLVGQHARAVEMLEVCISAPGNAVSAIQIDAYKKLVLVQLLVHGKTLPPPAYTSASTLTTCKNASPAYAEYAAAYMAENRARVQQLTESHRESFEKDFNYGLVLLLHKALRRRCIVRLTETFLTVSLDAVANTMGLSTDQAGLEEAERELLAMFEAKQIFGTLSSVGPDGTLASKTVTFTDDPEPYDSLDTVERIKVAIEKATTVDRSLRDLEGRVGRSKEFVLKAYNQSGNAGSMMGGGGGMGALGGVDDFDVHMASGEFGEGTDDEA